MATNLPQFQLNSQKWREENGLTGEEWQIYVRNIKAVASITHPLMFALGCIFTGAMYEIGKLMV